MAFGKAAETETRGLVRSLALAVCALALGLLVWRGVALLTGPGQPVSASPAEAALSDILTPVAGPGLTRLSVSYNGEGGRTVLLLLDETAAPRIPDLERIAPLAAGLIPERGDKLVIETIAFAEGLPGRPDMTAWLELGALASIALIGGFLAIMPGSAVSVSVPASQTLASPLPAPAERLREVPRAVRPVAVPASNDAAADIARRDPAKAAAIVRGWMTTKDENA